MSANVLVFILFLSSICIETCVTQDSIYFPSEAQGTLESSGNFNLKLSPSELESLRGTSKYEQYLDDIIARGIIKLTLEINKLLKSKGEGSENVVFSPISVAGALNLVFLGSNGLTFKEIANVLGLTVGISDIENKSQIIHEQFGRMIKTLNQSTGFQLNHDIRVASAVFVQQGYPIRPVYRQTAKYIYDSNIINLDFETNPQNAQKEINQWVSEKTVGKISDILNEPPPIETKVILASALYFKAEWEHPFFPNHLTKRNPWYINGANSQTNIMVDLMSNGGIFPYYNDKILGCEILGLPYKGSKSTMYILRPHNSNKDKVLEFESRLTEADLNALVRKTTNTSTVLVFPKMKLESTVDLRKTLESLGIRSLFDPKKANLALLSSPRTDRNTNTSYRNDFGADFQTVDNVRQSINAQSPDNDYQNPHLFADKVLHKVFMDITETGTEAAATTLVSLSKTVQSTVRIDVPFCFFIRHDSTNTILFWGSVILPTPYFKTSS